MVKRLFCLLFAALAVLTVTAPSASAAGRGPYNSNSVSGAPSAVQFSAFVAIAPPPGHDYYKSNCQVGESANVCGAWSVNETPDGMYWTLMKDAKWNPPGGDSSVAFRSISHSGVVLPWRTEGNDGTHCWYPSPVYNSHPTNLCPASYELHATAFDGANFSTAYKTTVDGSLTSPSCYVLKPFAKTIVSGTCPN